MTGKALEVDSVPAGTAPELSGPSDMHAEQLDCCSDPTGLCLLNEALESKRSAREGLLRAIRRAFPEAAHEIGQLAAARSQPVAGCGRSDAARNPLPISNAILRSRAGLASECDSPLAF